MMKNTDQGAAIGDQKHPGRLLVRARLPSQGAAIGDQWHHVMPLIKDVVLRRRRHLSEIASREAFNPSKTAEATAAPVGVGQATLFQALYHNA